MRTMVNIINTIKVLKKVSDDAAVAKLINMKPKTLATAKSRNSIPYEELSSFCNREKISLNWLLTGKGSMSIYDTGDIVISGHWRGTDDEGDRLRYISIKGGESFQMPESGIEEFLGITRGTLDDWLMEKKKRLLNAEESSMVSEGRVTYNKVSDDKEVTAKVSATAGEIIEGDFIFIPQVSGEISAGGGLLPDNTIEMKIAFKKDWIERKGDPRNMSLIRVSGDSMEPTLLSGDLVLVDHNRNCVDPQGGIYALSMDNMIMIKRVQMMWHMQKLKIISDNAKYEPIETSPEQISINGKVIWFGREIER